MKLSRKNAIDNFTKNLEIERLKLGLTQAEMAKKLELSTSGYKKLISGETQKIDFYLGILIYELTGRLFLDMCGFESEEINLLKKIPLLSPGNQRYTNGMVDFELSLQNTSNTAHDYIPLYIPTGNMEDGMLWDSANVEKIEVSKFRKQFGQNLHCAIRITSNHLHPVYYMGDILLVCRKSPRDGDTGIFFHKEDGCIYIRKYHQTNPCMLEPINGQGTVFYVDRYNIDDLNKWVKFGYVLTILR